MKLLLFAIFAFTANFIIGQTWYDVTVPTTQKLNDIDFPTSSVGYIVGDSATILKTIDGGEIWTQTPLTGLPTSPWGINITDVEFVDENIGFIVFQNNGYGPYKTIDGGNTWTDETNGVSNMCYKHSIYVNSETDFFLGGAGCFQSGQIERFVAPNWTPSIVNYESFDTGEQVVDMDFNNGIGIAAMHGQYFLRSIDNGTSWDTIPSNLGNGSAYLTCVMFATADTVYGGYDDGNGSGFALLMSTDAGLTWGTDNSTGSFFYPAFLSLAQANNGKVYAGGKVSWGNEGVLFERVGPGNWWMNSVDHPINGIASYDADVTFAVGDSGYVIVNTMIGQLGLENEQDLDAINIYPNPTSEFITINNELSETLIYNLVSLNGQIVIEKIQVNTTTTINVSHLESGIYFLESNDKRSSKKIIIQ